MQEIWKNVKDYEGIYQISNIGRLKFSNNKISKMNSVGRGGYKCTVLTKIGVRKSHTIHRLVALAFVPNLEDKPCINHKDGNKLNNNVENLEWCTYQENSIHAIENKLYTPSHGDFHHNCKVKDEHIETILKLNRDGIGSREIAKIYNVAKSTILRILNGKNKKYLNIDTSNVVKRNAKKRKITEDIVKAIRRDFYLGLTNKEIAKKYSISEGSSSTIINYKRY